MFLVDALLNATVYGGLFYIVVTAMIYAVDWSESRIRLEPVNQTTASTKSHILNARGRTSPSVKIPTVTGVEPENLMKGVESEFVAA